MCLAMHLCNLCCPACISFRRSRSLAPVKLSHKRCIPSVGNQSFKVSHHVNILLNQMCGDRDSRNACPVSRSSTCPKSPMSLQCDRTTHQRFTFAHHLRRHMKEMEQGPFLVCSSYEA
jgi:hypothetical protein